MLVIEFDKLRSTRRHDRAGELISERNGASEQDEQRDVQLGAIEANKRMIYSVPQ